MLENVFLLSFSARKKNLEILLLARDSFRKMYQ